MEVSMSEHERYLVELRRQESERLRALSECRGFDAQWHRAEMLRIEAALAAALPAKVHDEYLQKLSNNPQFKKASLQIPERCKLKKSGTIFAIIGRPRGPCWRVPGTSPADALGRPRNTLKLLGFICGKNLQKFLDSICLINWFC
jgi:hypothetical protein